MDCGVVRFGFRSAEFCECLIISLWWLVAMATYA